MLDELLKTLQQSDSQHPERTKKELLDDVQAYFALLTTPEPSTAPVVELLREGSRELIELLTKRYSLKEAEALPKGSVVLQLDSRLDVLVITPYIVGSDSNLIDFYKSKHLNHTPIVKADTNSAFIVLHIAKGGSMKDNVIEAKQKLDMLVAVLNLDFQSGSYIAEPIEEVKTELPKARKFGIGSAIYREVLPQAIQMPVGTVFKSETRNMYDDGKRSIDADVLVIGLDDQFIALNSQGYSLAVDLDEDQLLGLGQVVLVVDQLNEAELNKVMKGNAGLIRSKYPQLSQKYRQYKNQLVRRNPVKPKASSFKQWLYTVAPSFGTIKSHL